MKVKDAVKCKDCGLEYQKDAPHYMFCSARTCSECLATFSYTLPVYDSRPESCDDDGNPIRLCEECLETRLDSDEDSDED